MSFFSFTQIHFLKHCSNVLLNASYRPPIRFFQLLFTLRAARIFFTHPMIMLQVCKRLPKSSSFQRLKNYDRTAHQAENIAGSDLKKTKNILYSVKDTFLKSDFKKNVFSMKTSCVMTTNTINLCLGKPAVITICIKNFNLTHT